MRRLTTGEVVLDAQDVEVVVAALDSSAMNRQRTGFCTCDACRFRLDMAAAMADPLYHRAFTWQDWEKANTPPRQCP